MTLQIYVYGFYVIVAPVITPISVAPQVFAGETIQLNCFVSRGDSPVLISWFFNGEKLSMMGPLISTTQVGPLTSLLTINSATAWHSGNYSCVAGNRAGSTNYSVSLLVHGTCPLWLSMRKSMHTAFLLKYYDLYIFLEVLLLYSNCFYCGYTIFLYKKNVVFAFSSEVSFYEKLR